MHQRKIDSGEEDKDSEPPLIDSGYADYPGPIDRIFKNLEVMAQFGAYYFTLGPLVTFMILLQEISREKEGKLRQGLNVVGISHFTYWCNWIIIATVLNFI